MTAYLTSRNHARVKIKARTKSGWQVIDCLIDTGFSSGLALGESLLSRFGLQPVAEQEFELADGSSVFFDIFKTRTKFKNQGKDVLAVFTKSKDNLVGLEFLDNFKFVLDLKEKRISLD